MMWMTVAIATMTMIMVMTKIICSRSRIKSTYSETTEASIYLSIYLSIYPFVRLFVCLSVYGCLWSLFQFFILYTVDRTPFTGDQPRQGHYLHTEQHKHGINTHTHPCLEWDSNPQSQDWRERIRFMP
jgi:hypothetical protein